MHEILRGTILNTDFVSGSDPGILIRAGRNLDSRLPDMKFGQFKKSSFPWCYFNTKPEGPVNK